MPEKQLARDERRDEALREVAEPVVVVAREAERVAHPEAERHLGVRVVAAEAEDRGVDREKHVKERRERERAPGRDEHREPRGGPAPPP